MYGEEFDRFSTIRRYIYECVICFLTSYVKLSGKYMFEYIKTSLIYHYCFIEVPVLREKSYRSCIYVLEVSFSYFISVILRLDFLTVPMMCYCFFFFSSFYFAITGQRKPKGQSRLDNPETHATLCRRHRMKKKTQHGKLKR